MGPGPLWIENRKLEKQTKLKSLIIHVGNWFPKKYKLDRGWVDGVSAIKFVCDVWIFFTFARPLSVADVLIFYGRL